MQRETEEEKPLNSLADILNKEVHVDEFADAFLRVLHESTDGGLWDYLRQSSSSVEIPQRASGTPSVNCTVVDYDSAGSAPVNDAHDNEAIVDLAEDVIASDTLVEDIVRLSKTQDEKARAMTTAQSHFEFPEVAGLEHAINYEKRQVIAAHGRLSSQLLRAKSTKRNAAWNASGSWRVSDRKNFDLF
ncbi:hypothetical protein AAVH_13301 [Aphelenchoides avenae]|nr:hypothetical protein AAVH_13301 [Aphelenchus avenae]